MPQAVRKPLFLETPQWNRGMGEADIHITKNTISEKIQSASKLAAKLEPNDLI